MADSDLGEWGCCKNQTQGSCSNIPAEVDEFVESKNDLLARCRNEFGRYLC